MKVAIVGTGIAGNVAAYKLRQDHDITVFEANGRIGGHTNTVDVMEDGRSIPIDTGFIVFNDRTYPNFMRLLDEIGQTYRPSEMSFSVRTNDGALEYSSSALFAQRLNLLRPGFLRMISDILRFNHSALVGLERRDAKETVGEYLAAKRYCTRFTEHYLVPMAAAIWSAEPGAVQDMPISFLVRFFANHGLLQLSDRPTWFVIDGGSREYVEKLVVGHRHRVRLNCPVSSIRRIGRGVEIRSAAGTEFFDFAFIACHSDQSLAMLADATKTERQILSAIRYQPNTAVLHTDESLLPANRRAWSAWNYHVPSRPTDHVAVTYNMNILQRLEARKTYLVTLNDRNRIDPARIIRTIDYEHPVYTPDVIAAQRRQPEINDDRLFFCGAYWRNGFHEDGVVSALDALEHFNRRLAHGQLHLRRAG